MGETLGKMAEEIADVDLRKLCAIAPFFARETLEHIVEKGMQNESVGKRGKYRMFFRVYG